MTIFFFFFCIPTRNILKKVNVSPNVTQKFLFLFVSFILFSQIASFYFLQHCTVVKYFVLRSGNINICKTKTVVVFFGSQKILLIYGEIFFLNV